MNPLSTYNYELSIHLRAAGRTPATARFPEEAQTVLRALPKVGCHPLAKHLRSSAEQHSLWMRHTGEVGGDMTLKIWRTWAMPDADTFSVPIIGDFVRQYLIHSKVSIDPFARNKRWATHTNDLNPQTAAEHHMEAIDFLRHLQTLGVKADLLIFDPPYSPRQVKEIYNSIGKQLQMEDGQTSRLYKEWRNAAMPLLTNDAVVLSFGWNSVGFGKGNGFEQVEILLCAHGGAHNDTICVAERRVASDQTLLALAECSGLMR